MTSLSTIHLPDSVTPAARPRRRQVVVGLAVLGVVLIALLWALTAEFARDRRREAENIVLRETASAAAQLAGRADATIAAIDALLLSAAGMAADIDSAGLQRLLATQPSLNQISIIGPDGTVRASTLPNPPQTLADRAYFQAVRRHPELGLHVGAPIVGRVSPMRLVPLVRPISRADGSFGGVVVASLAPERLIGVPLRDIGPGTTYSLVGVDGVVRAKQVDGRITAGELVPHDRGLLPAFRVASSGVVRLEPVADRPARLIAYSQAGTMPLIAAVGIAVGGADGQFDETLAWLGLVALVGTLAIVGACVIVLVGWRRPAAPAATDRALAAMSHDLRTPLNAIMGCAALLDDDAGSAPLDARQRALLAEIVAAGNTLLAVIEAAQARAGDKLPG